MSYFSNIFVFSDHLLFLLLRFIMDFVLVLAWPLFHMLPLAKPQYFGIKGSRVNGFILKNRPRG